jgi:hypothetical protein
MKKLLFAALLLLTLCLPAAAATDIVIPPTWTGPVGQTYFKDFSRDLGLAISYVPLATAEPLGKTLPGIDLGVEATVVMLDTNQQYWKDVEAASHGSIPSALPIPKFHVQVGLPVIPIDLGFVYSSVPSTNIKYMGGEIKYAILEGTVATPALALRGAYTKLSGISDLEISTKSLDLSISKGFAMVTPYAGVGMVWIDSKETSPLVTLQDESIAEPKGFVGAKITFFPLMNLVAEADFAKVSSYSLRLNLHF